ncbi:hypothetical protein [Acidithiobacillus sp.]|nr:hypothetical protein [Acidithiobacillus sp.]MDD2748773.1 hypothetical protein [Acidithiobacillus sp.]MDD5280548.1 hypothetical protein [Acidithiobacillus sp.]
MPSTPCRKVPRSSTQAWQALLDQQAESGLTVTTFHHKKVALCGPTFFHF